MNELDNINNIMTQINIYKISNKRILHLLNNVIDK